MAGPNRFYEEITSEHVKILCTIGHGAFGTIYQARHRDWGIDVAIKILNCNTNFTQKELLNEARTMDEARFIYVLRLFGLFVGHVPGRSGTAPDLGLVMEYMENGSLYALKNKVSPVPWALRVRILHEVALGMNFLHSLSPPLLHLDLKPSNVLLDGDFHVRVADFGLSKVKRASVQKVTQDSASGDEYGYGGTLEFMPPEAFTDVNYKPSTSADVYSYGILMWSVLTEEEPYQHVHPGILSTQIRSLIPKGQRPNTKDLENKISHILKLEDLIHLMKRCWHNDRTRRPSFRDCSQETESIYLCFKPHIVSAVRQVQDILVQRESKVSNNTGGTSGRTLPGGISIPQFGTSPHQPPLASPSTFEEHFMTMRLEEPPSRQNEAVPPGEHFRTNQERRPAALHRSYSDWNTAELTENEKPQTEGVMFRTGTRPAGSRRPRSDTFVSPPYLGYQQYFPYWSGDPHESDPGFMRWSHSFLPHFHRRASQGHGEINFSGSDIRGMQIGNQNVMRLERLSQEKDKE